MDAIDWSAFSHAYGPATDAPAMLRALLGGDKDRATALEYLWGALTHQGTVWTATPPATPFLLRILGAPEGQHVRVELLGVLEVIASAISYHDVHGPLISDADRDTPEWLHGAEEQRRAVAASHQEVAKGFDVVLACLADEDPAVRAQAAPTLAAIALLPETNDADKARAVDVLRNAVDHESSNVAAAAAALYLGVLGDQTIPWLQDDRSEVRVAAALSPTARDDEGAHRVLVDALMNPAELDALFPDNFPGIDGYIRFTVLAAVCDRVADRSRALPALLRVLDQASHWTVDSDRGPILRYVFEGAHTGAPLTLSQRAVLDALVKRNDLWDPRNGNAGNAFRAVGLPYSREAVREIIAG